MSRWLKLIWFKEDPWTKVHAAVGINAKETLCGIERSYREILPSETYRFFTKKGSKYLKCKKCLAALRHRYGHEDVVKVVVK